VKYADTPGTDPATAVPPPIPAVSFTAPTAHPAAEPDGDETPADAPPPPVPPPPPKYARLEDWVSQHLATMIVRRHGNEFHWCPQWWQHPEAISRLTGLWQAWEQAYQDSSLAMLDWYRIHLDYHLAVLTDHNGPFMNCSNDQGHARSAGVLIKSEPAPAAYWGTSPPAVPST
jgi:Domain of unknown function (DUF4913)